MTQVAVVMPAWNEAEGIAGFITELEEALREWNPTFVVVDDCSTDGTNHAVGSLAAAGIRVNVHTHTSNLGHGPSTIEALHLGYATGAEYVVAVDGDGQFVGRDVNRLVRILTSNGADVVEGVRGSRDGPLYRKAVSLAVRVLVASKAGALPEDANTPLRAYRASTLASLLRALPDGAATPNLVISVMCRRWRLSLVQVPVESIPRRGSDVQGSTWGSVHKRTPGKRFVKFCVRATREWVVTPIPRQPVDDAT